MSKQVDLVEDIIKPTQRQREFMRAVVRKRYVLYGGSAGGGKSFSLRWTLVWLLTRWAAKGHRNVRVGLFCEDYPALKERHLSKVEIEFPDWLGKMRSADHEYKLNPEYGGGVIAFRNLDDPSKYLSSEFAAIAVDELTKNDLNTFNFLRMRLRWPEIEDTRFMAGTNPGGKGHCVPYGDVLTPNGWVDIKELKVGDPVYGVSHDGSLMETVVGQTHAHPYSGPLWVAKARGLHIACTPEHRIAKGNGVRLDSCRKFSLVKADELPGQSLVLRGVRYDGQPIESFTVPVFQQRVTKLKQPDTITGDQYARLMGWFLSEGCVIDCYKTFVITQMKQENLPVIESLLKGCGFSYRLTGQGFSVCSGKWWNYLRRFGKCREKYVPRELLNASTEQLRLFLEAAMAGDGHWASEDSGQYYTLSKRLADDMCEVLLKLGFTVSVNGRNRMGRNGLSYTVNFRRGEFQEILTGQHVYDVETECLKPKNVTHEPFDGMVYDIGVPEHHAFVIRQKGTVWVSGNSWVKGFWLDRSFPEEMEHLRDDFAFIPAKASDNPHLAESYIDGLKSLPEHLRKAYLEGSWDIFEGQVFTEWDSTRHIEDDPVIDPSWMRFRSMDWGFSKPYAVLWYAVDNDGCIHVYRELYGCREGMPDVGTQETAAEVAEKVKRLEKGEAISYGVADPSIWSKTGVGPSIAEEFTRLGVHWMPADNNRLAGKEQVHKRLRDGSLKVNRQCRGLIRTLPVLTYDPFKVEDVNTREEDHIFDSLKYGLMTRPWVPFTETPRKRDSWSEKVKRDRGEGAESWMAC